MLVVLALPGVNGRKDLAWRRQVKDIDDEAL
jgi:hypothetical protein